MPSPFGEDAEGTVMVQERLNHFLSDLRQLLPNAKITTTSPCWIPPCQFTASHQFREYQSTCQHFTPCKTHRSALQACQILTLEHSPLTTPTQKSPLASLSIWLQSNRYHEQIFHSGLYLSSANSLPSYTRPKPRA